MGMRGNFGRENQSILGRDGVEESVRGQRSISTTLGILIVQKAVSGVWVPVHPVASEHEVVPRDPALDGTKKSAKPQNREYLGPAIQTPREPSLLDGF